MIKTGDLNEALSIASQLGITFQRALIMSGVVTEEFLAPAIEIEKRVQSGKLTLDIGIKALRLVAGGGMTVDQALQELSKVHKPTGVVVTATNDLTNLLLAAKIITPEQLGEALKKTSETKMMVGQSLMIDQVITSNVLAAALNALFMIRDSGLDKDRAAQGLKYANQRGITIEQALFELQFFIQPCATSLRIGELFEMAGMISRSNMIECLEVEYFKKKAFEQILREQGLATADQLEAAVLLQSAVASESIKAYQAADALRRIRDEGVLVYQAMAEAQAAGDRPGQSLRLGELLIDAELITRAQVEEVLAQQAVDSNVKLGKLFLTAGLIKDLHLYMALRCQSLWKMGYMSGAQAAKALSHAYAFKVTLDEALTELQLGVPTRMQWSWV